MVRKCIIVFLFGLWQKTNAQEAWTLKQCIDYGLKNNRNNIIYANEKLAADAMAKEALGEYLPRVSLTSTLDNNLRLQQSIIPAGVFGRDEMLVSFTQKYNSDAVAQVDQVIYDQSMLNGLKAHKYHRQQADLNIQQSQEAIIYNISIAYFQILVYHEQLELLKYTKGSYEKQLEIYSLQVSKGTILQKDMDKVNVEYNNTLSNIRVAQSNLRLAENELKYEMGYPIKGALTVHLFTEMALPPRQEDTSRAFSPASRTGYQLAGLKIKIFAIEQSRIRAEGVPRLSAYFRYGAVGFGNQLKGAYGELFPYATVGLKLNIPILDFYRRNARYRQATINRLNAEETLKLAERKYTIEYEDAQTKFLQAQVNVENGKRNVALAASVLNITDLQFQKGTTDLTEWLSTHHSLKEAQTSYLNSLYSYYQARINLEKATGSLKTLYHSLETQWKENFR
jgi:outer membrane protein TolC